MKRSIHDFLNDFANQFDESPIELFKPETKFRELEEWSSLLALVIIAMVDEKYGSKLTGNDIRESVTIQDIFERVNQ